MSVSSLSQSTAGQELMVAALAKQQQVAQGQSALQLISASAPQPQTASPAPSGNPSIGQHVNIAV